MIPVQVSVQIIDKIYKSLNLPLNAGTEVKGKTRIKFLVTGDI